MIDLMNKYKKGTRLQIGETKAVVVSDLMKFQEFYAIYADVVEGDNNSMACATCKIHDKVALVIRDKKKLLDMGLTSEERKAIYCHELGHCFSHNQQESKGKGRNILDEIDSDTFAVKECGISPYTLEKALQKTYEYEIRNIGQKADLTQERLDRYVKEMKARKENARKLIHEYEDKEKSR